MDIFDLNMNDFKKEIKKLVNSYKPEELLEELKECGYQKEEYDIVIDDIKKEKYIFVEELEIDDECIEFLAIHNNEKSNEWRLVA